MMEEVEDPLEMCKAFVQHFAPRISPQPLSQVCQSRIKKMICEYPQASEQKTILMRGLKGLFDIPKQFIPEFLDALIAALKEKPQRSSNNVYGAIDLFLISQILHPSIHTLDMEQIPTALRNIVIRNIHRMPGIRNLNLHLSLTMPWSSFFSEQQTSRFISAIRHLHTLSFSNFADDCFLGHLGQHCFNLTSLDVQGSIAVTDKALQHLSELIKLQTLDVNRTSVSPHALLSFLHTMPGITSLGSWEDFNNFEEETMKNFRDIRFTNINLCELNLNLLTNLSKLSIKMTNCSQKLHTLGILRNLTSISIADVNYRQSKLGVALLGLSKKLQTLTLDHVNGWDSTDLRSIGQHCLHLENLTLSNCTIGARNVLTESDKKVKYFPRISSLFVSSNISHSQFLVLTGHAHGLKHLQTGNNCWITTRLVSHLVKLNNLENLKFLRFDYTKDLSATVLFLILKNAKHLERIVGVETWHGLNHGTCQEMNQLFQRRHFCHRLVTYNEITLL